MLTLMDDGTCPISLSLTQVYKRVKHWWASLAFDQFGWQTARVESFTLRCTTRSVPKPAEWPWSLVHTAHCFTFCIRILFTRFWPCISSPSPWFNVVHAPAVSWNVITCLCASSQFNNAKKIRGQYIIKNDISLEQDSSTQIYSFLWIGINTVQNTCSFIFNTHTHTRICMYIYIISNFNVKT